MFQNKWDLLVGKNYAISGNVLTRENTTLLYILDFKRSILLLPKEKMKQNSEIKTLQQREHKTKKILCVHFIKMMLGIINFKYQTVTG